ncbi:alkylation response protein AidB-like acyl-CoA dehydrogenase [Mycolicibacterium sp. BK556]|uniref:acyl-CoA dehydrogenase family protein n=1 Tax=unclassified Mycolicibacterium TaxID=2636767 RepID=UPI00160EA1FB|nr:MULTISPECIES: acyl-CoA dehydrogenase [unclassified Mycolicibacterium]MBB3600405.1 alkylation response protein AidB-like acyl-CoA dehydrogenase [Mycolicibacterium sp. BK556]MBB3630157.1 alkylation response protein AidB-like acyl-CoA dehydrogenase [Mycolicibacterium sp. BK607]
MNSLTTYEKQELGRSTRLTCERFATLDRVREVSYQFPDLRVRGFDAQLWRLLCQQVGIATIAVPEHAGGAGYGTAALSPVAHELGRSLAPVPFVASLVLATGLLIDCDNPDAPVVGGDTLTALLDGEHTAAAVLTEDGGLWHRGASAMTAIPDGGPGARLSGVARHVLHGGAAEHLVVVANTHGEPGVYLVSADQSAVTVLPERVLDPTRPMATVRFDNAHGTRLRPTRPVDAIIERRMYQAIAILAAEQVGANERALEIAVEYANTREQFGRVIGSFQAIKHRCADLLVELEMSRSACQAALEAVDDDPEGSAAEVEWRCSMAKAVCSESLRNVAHQNLQIHGGVGFTWEDSAHLYLKRARTDEVLFGTPAQHWDRISVAAGVH